MSEVSLDSIEQKDKEKVTETARFFVDLTNQLAVEMGFQKSSHEYTLKFKLFKLLYQENKPNGN